jgi:hypothetical protein
MLDPTDDLKNCGLAIDLYLLDDPPPPPPPTVENLSDNGKNPDPLRLKNGDFIPL